MSGIGIADGGLALPLAAAAGTLVLAYLLALDAAEAGLTSGRPGWIRGRLAVLAGLAASLITAAAAGHDHGARLTVACPGGSRRRRRGAVAAAV